MTLGESARKARKEAGLTQNKLSEISGVCAPTIFSIESADRNPSVLTVEALAMALGISMEEYICSAIDCVHVVRCKMFCHRLKNEHGEPAKYNFCEDDFCSYGERKDNGC